MDIKKILIGGAFIAWCTFNSHSENLVILHTNDTHSQIDPASDNLGGVARRKVLIDSVRAANENVLLIDLGDIVQGTLYFNIYKGKVEEELMNALGYDIRILGNHEFDNGMEALAENLANADATLLAANYQMRGTPLEDLFEPYTIREYAGKRIAFLPVNLNPNGMIAAGNYNGMGYIEALDAADTMAWYLKNILQADYVVALTHIGYRTSNKEDDVKLAKSSKDIDVIIGGHSHTTIDPTDPKSPPYKIANADGREIIVAQAGRYGKMLGEIVINLDDLTALPEYRLIAVDSRLDDRIDPMITDIIFPYRAAVDSLNSNKIAKTAKELDKSEPPLLNFGSDMVTYRGRQMADNVDFGILNKGGLRNSLPKGDVSEGQLITMMPFFNRIMVIDLPGDKVAEAFDVMAKANGNGVSKEVEAIYDPDTDKCLEITISGKPLDPNKTYRIATIDYLANGGDYMSPLKDHTEVATSENYLYEDLIEYFRTGPGKGKKINPSDKVRMAPNK